MGKVSVKEDKNIYQLYREEAHLTRAAASELLEFITESRIERIENGSVPQPDEVVAMALAYKKPELCNYFCSHECRIGREYVPEIRSNSSLQAIVLEILSKLNALNREKDRLIDISVDGKISDDEMPEFLKIRDELDEMSLTIDSLKLWLDKSLIEKE